MCLGALSACSPCTMCISGVYRGQKRFPETGVIDGSELPYESSGRVASILNH